MASLGAIGDTELAVDVPEVELDRLLGHPESASDDPFVAPDETSWRISSSRVVSGRSARPPQAGTAESAALGGL